jgi:uncharacterized protein YeaO (DUF488 family)
VAIRIVRLGSARQPAEGLRLGTVRRPPRGVRKEDYARLDYYDLWLPELSPSVALVAGAQRGGSWKVFARRYRAEMSRPPALHVLELLAVLSRTTDVSVGCYCEDESRCHRSLLRELLVEKGAEVR